MSANPTARITPPQFAPPLKHIEPSTVRDWVVGQMGQQVPLSGTSNALVTYMNAPSHTQTYSGGTLMKLLGQ